ncbi:MAG: lipoyl(octanoyl) transferase LipB [Candidatus Kapaibacterium sp.]
MITIEHWGLIEYNAAWDMQKQYVAEIQRGERNSTLVLCEHPTVITIGRNGTEDNVTASNDELDKHEVSVIPINRGGDVTLHNPGQLVGYPIFRLTDFKEDLHWFLREIEECIIELLQHYSILGERVDGLTGVWIDKQRKVCAIGLNCSRWVTSHGFALNVENDISEFNFIVPCGITDKEVTSISKECNQKIAIQEVAEICAQIFSKKFV